MKKKGFTLAELVGVIVLLGLITIISFPLLLNHIKNSSNNLDKATQDLIIANASNYLEENKSDFPKKEGNVYCITLGTLVDSGKLSYDLKDTKGEKLSLDKFIQVKVEDKKYNYLITDTCQSSNYQEPILRGADPKLGSGMIAVTINDNGIVNKADVTTKWYSYEDKMWANAVTVTDDSREKYMNAEVGTIIAESDILTYLVWIPRYKYKLWNVDNVANSGADLSQIREINVIFESKGNTKSLGNSNGTYLTHPAFTFGDEELNGFWVGKFETSKEGDSVNNSIAGNEVRIKPNIKSWTSIQVANAFYTTRAMSDDDNIFGLSAESDSHMMKNIEWGAVAYLSHSKYGNNYEVRLNNNSGRKTGCGAKEENGTGTSECEIQYGTAIKYPQSTTGNISGIFDMSGGTWEYVMGVILDSTNMRPVSGRNSLYNSGFNGPLSCAECDVDSGNNNSIVEISDGQIWPEEKYYDTYAYSNSEQEWNRGFLGDSTREMGPYRAGTRSSWYSDYAYFVSSNFPWIARGGQYSNATGTGIFAFYREHGRAYASNTFRVVILGK